MDMDRSTENFDIVFKKIAEASEDTYAVSGIELPTELDEIAELRRFATALADHSGYSYTSS